MNTRWMPVILAAALFTGALSLALAQGGPGPGGRMGGMPLYDPATEITLHGTIQEVVEHEGWSGWKGVHLLVKSETETVEVHLGPAEYIAEEGFAFASGDALEILGSRVSIAGKPVLIAREVRAAGRVLTLRDEAGRPAWAGGRWRWTSK